MKYTRFWIANPTNIYDDLFIRNNHNHGLKIPLINDELKDKNSLR